MSGQRPGFSFYFPLMTSPIISVVLSVILRLVNREPPPRLEIFSALALAVYASSRTFDAGAQTDLNPSKNCS